MPLQEAAIALPQDDVMIEAATVPPVEAEQTALGDEAAHPAVQGYEYTRQDGTVEHAASREEAIRLCPVLGNLAMQDSEAADLLLDMASIGQAKMAEQTEGHRQEIHQQSESAVKPEPPAKPAGQPKGQPSEKVVNGARTETTVAEAAHWDARAKAVAADTEQRSTDIVSEREPSPPENLKNVVEPEPERHRHQEQPSPIQPTIAIENRPIHDQQIHEAARLITPEEAVTVAVGLEPPADAAEIGGQTSQAFVHEGGGAEADVAVEADVAAELRELPIDGPEPIVQTRPAVIDVILSDESTIFEPEEPEQSPAGQELPRLIDEPNEEAALPIIEPLTDSGQAQPAYWEAEVIEDPASAAAETWSALYVEQVELVSGAYEADGESAPIYESFSEALRVLVAMPGESSAPELESEPLLIDDEDIVKPVETPAVEVLPDVAVKVSERLSEIEIEVKETAVPILEDIVETMHVIEVLNVEETESEAIETAQAELEELVITLFEHIGLEYEAEEAEQFIAVLLRPEFLAPQAEVIEHPAVDLEQDGTHEAKYHFAQYIGGLADDEDLARSLVGKLTLFYAIGGRPRIPALRLG